MDEEKMNFTFESDPTQPEQPAQAQQPEEQQSAWQAPQQNTWEAPQYGGGYRYYQQPRQSAAEGQNDPYSQNWQQPQPEQKKKKKDRKGLKLTALLVAVAIVAGLGGAALSGAISGLKEKNRKEKQAEPKAAETMAPAEEKTGDGKTDMGSYQLQASPLPETLKTNTGDKSLTPKQVYNMNVNAVVGITTEGTTTNVFGQLSRYSTAGSGFIITEDGYVVTNNHVVEGTDKVSVQLYSGEEYEAVFVGGDATNDVALLKIEGEFPCVSIGDSEKIEVGEQVIAIGNPLGELTNTMTAGYISALDREINTNGTPINMLQTDAAINSGNSGGALFDMNGNVIGITSAKYSGQTSSGAYIESINFAIPINDAMKIVYDLQKYGYVKNRAYLGVTVKDLDTATASSYGLPVGPIVQSVVEGSCADKAGIESGDIILSIGEKKVEGYADMVSVLNRLRAGDTVTITVFRTGVETDLEVTLDERPQDDVVEQTEEEANSNQQTPYVSPENPYSYPGQGDSGDIEDFFSQFPFNFFGY